MKIDVIGTSCTWFERKNTSFVIDKNIIFDVPNGAYKDIISVIGLENLETIDAIIISHFHSDHFADLRVFTTRFMRELKNLKAKKKVYAPKGCLDALINLNKAMFSSDDELSKSKHLEKIEFIDIYDGFEFEVGNYKVIAHRVDHGKLETYGFVFTDKKGTRVGFSADTCVCDGLKKILSSSDFAFVEMAAVEKSTKHICIEEFEELIKEYPNCKLFPVHTSDHCQEYAEKNAMNFLKDGQVLNLK